MIISTNPSALRGLPDGLASLDGTGRVPASQLPSYVDDVLEYADLASFPATGSTGIIYIDISANAAYRWSGTTYVQISAVSSVTSVAGRVGDVVLSKSDVALGNADNTSDASKPVSIATQAALDLKADDFDVDNVTLESVSGGTLATTGTDAPAIFGSAWGTVFSTHPMISQYGTATNGVVTATEMGPNQYGINLAPATNPASIAASTWYLVASVQLQLEDFMLTLEQSVTYEGAFNGGHLFKITQAAVTSGFYALTIIHTGDPTFTMQPASGDPSALPTLKIKAITKTMVGLPNVDNTSDASKPVSTLQQAALDLKADDFDVDNVTLEAKIPFSDYSATTVSYHAAFATLSGWPVPGYTDIPGGLATLSSSSSLTFMQQPLVGVAINQGTYYIAFSGGDLPTSFGTLGGGANVNITTALVGTYSGKKVYSVTAGANALLAGLQISYAAGGVTPRYIQCSATAPLAATTIQIKANKDADNNQTGTAYTLVLADADSKTIWMNNVSANTLTIPANASVAFAVGTKINVIMEGSGTTTILAATGVTLNGVSGGSVFLTRYQGASLTKRATNSWIVTGAV